MRQRTETMLNGLWVYPMIEGENTLSQLPKAVKRLMHLKVTDAEAAGEANHVFTHQVWNMRLYVFQAEQGIPAPEGWRFVDAVEMAKLAIPTAVRAAQRLAQERLEKTV